MTSVPKHYAVRTIYRQWGTCQHWRDKARWQAEIPSETLSLSGTVEVHTLSRATVSLFAESRLPLTERCDRVNGGCPPCRPEAGNNRREEKNAGDREDHDRIVNVSARPMPENAIQ